MSQSVFMRATNAFIGSLKRRRLSKDEDIIAAMRDRHQQEEAQLRRLNDEILMLRRDATSTTQFNRMIAEQAEVAKALRCEVEQLKQVNEDRKRSSQSFKNMFERSQSSVRNWKARAERAESEVKEERTERFEAEAKLERYIEAQKSMTKEFGG